MALHDGDCVISGMPRYDRKQVLEALVKLAGVDGLIADLSLVAYNEGYIETSDELDKAWAVANAEGYTLR